MGDSVMDGPDYDAINQRARALFADPAGIAPSLGATLPANPVVQNASALGGRPIPTRNVNVPAVPKNPENNLTIARRQREQGENPTRDPTAQNPYSSAGGNNQIVDQTWLGLMKRNRPEMVQGKSDPEILAMKTDGDLNNQMAAQYDQDNAKVLASNGIAPTPNFINVLYRAGPGDGLKLIQAAHNDPAALVKDIAPALAHPGNNGAGNLTVGQFLTDPYQKGPGAQESDTPQQMFTIAKGNQILSQMLDETQQAKARVAEIDKDYKPLEYPKKPEPPQTDPLKAFSSVAGLFAVLAAGFSKTPAIAAMNGMAGAIDAAKKSDWETYQAQFDQFKTQSELALKAHEQHHKDVTDAMEMMTKNISAGTAMLQAISSISHDEEMSKHLAFGDYIAADQLRLQRQKAAEETQAQLPITLATMPLVAAMQHRDAAVKSGDPAAIKQADDLVSQAESQLANVKRSMAGGGGTFSRAQPVQVTTPDGKTQNIMAQQDPVSGGWVTANAARTPIAGDVLPTTEVRAEQKAARSQDALLTPDDLKPMVEAYIAGDKTQLTNVGRGAQGPENLTLFRHAWAAELKARGLTGVDQVAAFVRLSSDLREAGAIGTRVGAIEVSDAEAKRVASLVTTAYEKLPREQFRPFNELQSLVENKRNSKEQAAALAADFALVTAYARALNPSGVPRESDINAGKALLSLSDSQESHAATINQMLMELDQIKLATGDARTSLIDRIRAEHGFQAAGGSGTPAQTQGGPGEGAAGTTSKSGKPIVYRNGQWEYK